MLVLMGTKPKGKKELIGFQTGLRESAQSWKGIARRSKGARLGHRAGSRYWRCRARALESPRRGVPADAPPRPLGAQNAESPVKPPHREWMAAYSAATAHG